MNPGEYNILIKHYALTLETISDIAEFTGEEEYVVLSKITQGALDLKKMWGEHKDNAESFYHNNPAYLYDLADFNCNAVYFKYRLGAILSIHGAKVLDLGCGIGTATFLMSDNGNRVTGYDINQPLIDFCEFRKRKYTLDGSFTSVMPQIGEFDYIVAIDTLEHIEDLGGFLKMVGEEAKEGAVLIHCDCFSSFDVSPMHFDYSDKIDLYLRDAGFIKENHISARKNGRVVSLDAPTQKEKQCH